MSDYIFHPRYKFPVSDHTNVYYGNSYNPYRIKVDQGAIVYTQSSYIWGRFWEIIDWYAQDPVNNMPTNLGLIEVTEIVDPGDDIITYEYLTTGWWYAAFDYNTEFYTYLNTDTYSRDVRPYLGDVACFRCPDDTGYTIAGIVEKIDLDVTNYKLSATYGSNYNNFIVIDVVGDEFVLQNRRYRLEGFVGNPINQLYNVIAGRGIYWKLPFWIYKRYLDRRRGLIYE